ncbi:hypothetical protein WJX73_010419 [Symbiochloris irregularis]|uniref:Putative zinc-finger domain-containing protein n=1 Tax=Symbiochloris irregularis TaxID=706552 RepID=A0AAW1NTK0_9CHLO
MNRAGKSQTWFNPGRSAAARDSGLIVQFSDDEDDAHRSPAGKGARRVRETSPIVVPSRRSGPPDPLQKKMQEIAELKRQLELYNATLRPGPRATGAIPGQLPLPPADRIVNPPPGANAPTALVPVQHAVTGHVPKASPSAENQSSDQAAAAATDQFLESLQADIRTAEQEARIQRSSAAKAPATGSAKSAEQPQRKRQRNSGSPKPDKPPTPRPASLIAATAATAALANAALAEASKPAEASSLPASQQPSHRKSAPTAPGATPPAPAEHPEDQLRQVQIGKATLLARKAVLDQVLEEARLEFVELRQQELALIAQLGNNPIPDNNIPTPDTLLRLAAAAADPDGPASPSFPGFGTEASTPPSGSRASDRRRRSPQGRRGRSRSPIPADLSLRKRSRSRSPMGSSRPSARQGGSSRRSRSPVRRSASDRRTSARDSQHGQTAAKRSPDAPPKAKQQRLKSPERRPDSAAARPTSASAAATLLPLSRPAKPAKAPAKGAGIVIHLPGAGERGPDQRWGPSAFSTLPQAVLGPVKLAAEPVATGTESKEQLTTALDQYESPLRLFRSYRLCETFTRLAKLKLTSSTFTHALDVQWPLCPFELRGACRDANCSFQMTVDYDLDMDQKAENLINLFSRAGSKAAKSAPPPSAAKVLTSSTPTLLQEASRHILLQKPVTEQPSAGWTDAASGRPSKDARVSLQKRHELAVEADVPIFSRGSQQPSVGQLSFRSQYLHAPVPVPIEQSWQLNPKLATFFSAGSFTVAEDAAATATLSVVADARRYFGQAGIEAPPSEAAPARQPFEDWYEQHLSERPQDEDKWLEFAVEHLRSAPCVTKSGYTMVLRVLARGLEMNRNSGKIWCMYLHLYAHKPASSNGRDQSGDHQAMAAAAVGYQAHSYGLWVVTVSMQSTWKGQVSQYAKAIIALAGAPAAGHEQELNRAHCMLDLALRLMQLLITAGAQAELAAWVQSLNRMDPVSSTWAPPGDIQEANLQQTASKALQHSLQGHAGPCATLWLAAAHVAAWGRLPDCCINSLGYPQRAPLLQWDPAPPVSTNAAVASLLRNAASKCLGCLDLAGALQGTVSSDPEAGFDADQRSRETAALLQAWLGSRARAIACAPAQARALLRALPWRLGLVSHESLHPALVSTLACRSAQLAPDASSAAEAACAVIGAWVLDRVARSRDATPARKDDSSSSSSGSDSGSSSRSSSSPDSSASSRSRSPPRKRTRHTNDAQKENAAPPVVLEAGYMHQLEAEEQLVSSGTLRRALRYLLWMNDPERRTSQDRDVEEGEIDDVSEDSQPGGGWTTDKHTHAWLLLALFERMSGDGAGACNAVDKALANASGNVQLEQMVWREYLALVGSPLMKPPAQGTSSSQSGGQAVHVSITAGRAQSFAGLMGVLRKCWEWEGTAAPRQALDLPLQGLQEQGSGKQSMLQLPPLRTAVPSQGFMLSLLAHLELQDIAHMTEAWLRSGAAKGPEAAQVLVEMAACRPSDASFSAWALPLAARSLALAIPPPPVNTWLRAVMLVEKHSSWAADELCAVALARYPHSYALADKAAAIVLPAGAKKHWKPRANSAAAAAEG